MAKALADAPVGTLSKRPTIEVLTVKQTVMTGSVMVAGKRQGHPSLPFALNRGEEEIMSRSISFCHSYSTGALIHCTSLPRAASHYVAPDWIFVRSSFFSRSPLSGSNPGCVPFACRDHSDDQCKSAYYSAFQSPASNVLEIAFANLPGNSQLIDAFHFFHTIIMPIYQIKNELPS
jgi:hypothetical protein